MKFFSAFLIMILIVSTAQAARYKRVLHFTESDSASVQPDQPSEPIPEDQVQAANNHKANATAIDNEIMDLDTN